MHTPQSMGHVYRRHVSRLQLGEAAVAVEQAPDRLLAALQGLNGEIDSAAIVDRRNEEA